MTDAPLSAALARMAFTGQPTSSSCDALTASSHAFLVDACMTFIRTLGTEAMQAAAHAGRSQANLLDLLAALDLLRTSTPQDLLRFSSVASTQPRSVVQTAPPAGLWPSVTAAAIGRDRRHPHIPEFLPALPAAHTYDRVAQNVRRPRDGKAVRKGLSKMRRAARGQLTALAAPTARAVAIAADAEAAALGDGEPHSPQPRRASAAAAPPPSVPPVGAAAAAISAELALPCGAVEAGAGGPPLPPPAEVPSGRAGALLQLLHARGLDEPHAGEA